MGNIFIDAYQKFQSIKTIFIKIMMLQNHIKKKKSQPIIYYFLCLALHAKFLKQKVTKKL